MKKPGAVSPRNPASTQSVVHVAGLGPSRSDSVMAQLFIPIHELTGALTRGAQTAPFLPNWHCASWCVIFCP